MIINELLFVVRLVSYFFLITKHVGRVKVILLVIIPLIQPHLHPQRSLVCYFIDVLIDFIVLLLLDFIIYVIRFFQDVIIFINDFMIFIILIINFTLAYIVAINDFIVFILIFIDFIILIFLVVIIELV